MLFVERWICMRLLPKHWIKSSLDTYISFFRKLKSVILCSIFNTTNWLPMRYLKEYHGSSDKRL